MNSYEENARGGPPDEHAAEGLVLHIDNTSELSLDGPRGQGHEILKNQLKRWNKGEYDFEKSVKMMEYLAESGAKHYVNEYHESTPWNRMFSPETRRLAARMLATDFRRKAQQGEYERNGGPPDEDAAEELVLYIDNTSELSLDGPRGQGHEILKNQLKRWNKGEYDFEKSVKMMEFLAESGAKQYVKENHVSTPWNRMFSPETRRLAARKLAEDFRRKASGGEFEANGGAKRYIGDAVVTVSYHDDGDYRGTVKAGGQTWRFRDLQAPKMGFRFASDSPDAYDAMAASAVSFGAYYTSHNRGDDVPDWAPDPNTADAIDSAVSWAQDDSGRYAISRSPGGPTRFAG